MGVCGRLLLLLPGPASELLLLQQLLQHGLLILAQPAAACWCRGRLGSQDVKRRGRQGGVCIRVLGTSTAGACCCVLGAAPAVALAACWVRCVLPKLVIGVRRGGLLAQLLVLALLLHPLLCSCVHGDYF